MGLEFLYPNQTFFFHHFSLPLFLPLRSFSFPSLFFPSILPSLFLPPIYHFPLFPLSVADIKKMLFPPTLLLSLSLSTSLSLFPSSISFPFLYCLSYVSFLSSFFLLSWQICVFLYFFLSVISQFAFFPFFLLVWQIGVILSIISISHICLFFLFL